MHQLLPLGYLKVFEVYAYYKDTATKTADQGTVLRFVERTGVYASREGFGNPEGVIDSSPDCRLLSMRQACSLAS